MKEQFFLNVLKPDGQNPNGKVPIMPLSILRATPGAVPSTVSSASGSTVAAVPSTNASVVVPPTLNTMPIVPVSATTVSVRPNSSSTNSTNPNSNTASDQQQSTSQSASQKIHGETIAHDKTSNAELIDLLKSVNYDITQFSTVLQAEQLKMKQTTAATAAAVNSTAGKLLDVPKKPNFQPRIHLPWKIGE